VTHCFVFPVAGSIGGLVDGCDDGLVDGADDGLGGTYAAGCGQSSVGDWHVVAKSVLHLPPEVPVG